MIVGLGGLGSPAALYLAGAGIGRLVLNDFDRVDASNLPRQILFAGKHVDDLKTAAAKETLHDHNPAVQIETLDTRLSDDKLHDTIKECDLVLDCTDHFAVRCAINRACFENATALVTGAAIRFEGQLAVFRHDQRGPGDACYQCLYSEEDEHLDDCAGQGILAPVVGMIGCLMATEAIKILAGLDPAYTNKLWVYDGLAGTSKVLGIRSRPNCPVCGSSE